MIGLILVLLVLYGNDNRSCTPLLLWYFICSFVQQVHLLPMSPVNGCPGVLGLNIEVPSLVDGKRSYLALVSDFVTHTWVQDTFSFHPRVMEPVSFTTKRRNIHVFLSVWCEMHHLVSLRPIQFNYLSYKLFLEKNPVKLQKKKKKKKSPLVPYGRKWFWNFLSDSKKKKKKSASFKNILCKGDSVNYRKLSLL